MFNYEIKEKCRCSIDEKIKCLDTIGAILELSNGARCSGLLFLENEIKKYDDFLLRTGIRLVLDGREPNTIGKILKNYIISSESEGYQLLNKIIVREGVLLIQEGATSFLIKESLISILGEEVREHADRYFNIYETQAGKSQEFAYSYLRKVRDRHSLADERLEIKKLIFCEDTVRKLSTSLDINPLAYALRGLSGNLQCRILQSMNHDIAVSIIRIMDKINIYDPSFIKKSNYFQNMMVDKINQLERTGEVINIELPVFEAMLKNYYESIRELH